MAATQLGKRYECAVCQTVVMCLSAGPEPFMCCDRPMEERLMEPLPSGD